MKFTLFFSHETSSKNSCEFCYVNFMSCIVTREIRVKKIPFKINVKRVWHKFHNVPILPVQSGFFCHSIHATFECTFISLLQEDENVCRTTMKRRRGKPFFVHFPFFSRTNTCIHVYKYICCWQRKSYKTYNKILILGRLHRIYISNVYHMYITYTFLQV